jgi:hypothetical protein
MNLRTDSTQCSTQVSNVPIVQFDWSSVTSIAGADLSRRLRQLAKRALTLDLTSAWGAAQEEIRSGSDQIKGRRPPR